MKIELKGKVTIEIIERLFNAFDVSVEDGKVYISVEEGEKSSE